MKKNILIILFIIVFIILGILLERKLSVTENNIDVDTKFRIINLGELECPGGNKSCDFSGENISLTIELADRIKYLHYFSVRVLIHSAESDIKSVRSVFRMVNMDMGLNQFILKPVLMNKDKKSIWHTNAILPVCVTGRKDWQMELEIETSDQKKYRLNIPFQVTE